MNGFPVIIDHKEAHVSYKTDTLVIKTSEASTQSLPIELISYVVIHGKPAVESDVWRHLADKGIPAVIIPLKGQGQPAWLGAGLTNSIPLRMTQYSCYQTPACRHDYALQLVYLKYLAQCRTLELLNIPHIANILPIEHVGLNKLLGLEGTLARNYFNALKPAIESHWNFNGRNRQPPKDPLNAFLSLSYTMLTLVMQRVIQETGLDPWLGIYHQPYPGRPALAIDLIEPIRPQLDLWVIQTLHESFRPEDFANSDQDGCRLIKEKRHDYYHAWADLCAQFTENKTLEQYCREQVVAFIKYIRLNPYAKNYQDDAF
ncbi:CRISPR-associated endonuclease Cas1 [Thiomicrospira microaerophila]|uniref:CRISPR-associated endonuclease Cas1 n=1 Tax=Thiomicrospira microaerophila TaxID=406020 RepID=UPI00069610DB|nr:CRISPR-associated endonuclease Cas1 [Thiomicrospira microaerophila]